MGRAVQYQFDVTVYIGTVALDLNKSAFNALKMEGKARLIG